MVVAHATLSDRGLRVKGSVPGAPRAPGRRQIAVIGVCCPTGTGSAASIAAASPSQPLNG